MRIFRIALATALLSLPTAALVLTASAAHAAPFEYSSVNVGSQSACAVTTVGKVLCWGTNFDQSLIPTRTERYLNSPVPVTFPEAIATVDVGAGDTHCALAVSGHAYCWGNGGHLGSYFTTVSRTPVQVEFPNDMRVTNVQNGYGNGCAVDASRDLWCWGDALSLGDGNIDPVRVPVHLTMPDNSHVENYDMGSNGTCVVTEAANMYCWGPINSNPSPWGNVAYPVLQTPAPTGTTWSSVSIEGERVCGITTNGSGYCRGDNYNGNFGNGTYDDSQTMTRMIVPNNESVQSIHMGSYATCIVTTVNNIWCVGEGGNGQLGTGTTMSGRTWRQPVFPAGVGLSGLSMNHSGTCGLDANAQIWCWAYIANYELNGGLVFNNLLPILRPQVGSPEVTTPIATSITTSSALLSASASPFGFATTGSLEYSTDVNFTSSTTVNVAGSTLDGSLAAKPLNATISGLSPRTTYYVRARAHNAAGDAVSGVFSFLTLGSEPTVNMVSTGNVTGNEATVYTEVDPGLLFSSVNMQYSSTNTFTNNTPSISMGTVSGNSTGQLSAQLTDLLPRHSYFVRVIATNVLGTTESESVSFSTVGDAPALTSFNGSATNSSINASVEITTGNSRGTVSFEVSRVASFSSIVYSDARSFTSGGPHNFSFTAYGLTKATDYFIRATVTNDLGNDTSNVLKVRTRGSAPVVGSLTVQPILRGAVLSFPLDPTGISTMAVVDIGDNGDFRSYTSHFAYSGSSDGIQYVSITVNNLSPTIEHFARVSSYNELGHSVSNIVSFRTIRPIGVVINNDEEATHNPHVTLNFRYPGDTVAIRVSNNDNFAGARIYSPVSSIEWDLITADEPNALRTVYVQFINARGVPSLYEAKIALASDIAVVDEDAPVITSLQAVSAQTTSTVSAASVTTVKKNMRTFVVAVSDKNSGVTRIQTKVGARIITHKVDAQRKGEYSLAFAKSVKSFSIRVIDREGNASKWKKITIR